MFDSCTQDCQGTIVPFIPRHTEKTSEQCFLLSWDDAARSQETCFHLEFSQILTTKECFMRIIILKYKDEHVVTSYTSNNRHQNGFLEPDYRNHQIGIFRDSELRNYFYVKLTHYYPGNSLRCYSEIDSWWRYIECDTVRGYLSCFTRYADDEDISNVFR